MKIELNRFVKTTLVVLGVLVAGCIGAFAFFVARSAHAKDSGEPERVAAQIANFTVPKGFRETFGLDLLFVKQSTMVATDSAKPMTIMVQGLSIMAPKDAADESIVASLKVNCSKLHPLGDDLLTANGALFTLHRFSCVGAAGTDNTIEYEAGSFTGKMPTVTILAFAPQASWSSAPIHALLRSLH